MRLVVACAVALASAACTSPDDASGDFHLEVVQAPATATPGSIVPQVVVVRVVNGDGTSIPGMPVRWSVRSGGGRITAAADTSGVDGLAAAEWIPGLATGSQAIGATLFDQPALTITVKTDAFHADKLSTTLGQGCGLRGTEVWCWQDGYSQPIRRILPQFEARDMAASYSSACVLDAAGSTYCNLVFQGSDPQEYSTIPGLPPLKSIAGGGRNFCGVAVADDTAWCWRDFAPVPAQASASLALSHLSVGNTYACGLDAAAMAWCWNPVFGGATMVAGGRALHSVSANEDGASACGIAGSDVWCWLSNQAPVRVVGINAGQVALGWPFALLNTGPMTIAALPQEDYGTTPTLELTAYDASSFPLPVRQVYPTCVLAQDGAAYCLAAPDVNLPVIPTPTYWKAVAAPPS